MLKNYCKEFGSYHSHPHTKIKLKKLNKLKIDNHLPRLNRKLKSQINWYPETWKDKQIPRITDYQGQKPLPGARN